MHRCLQASASNNPWVQLSDYCQVVKGTQRKKHVKPSYEAALNVSMSLLNFPGQPVEGFQGIRNIGGMPVKRLRETIHRCLQASASNNPWRN